MPQNDSPIVFRWALWKPSADSIHMLSHSIGTFAHWFGSGPEYIVYTDSPDLVSKQLQVDADVLTMHVPSARYLDDRATWLKWAPRFRHDPAAFEFRIDSDIFLVDEPAELRSFIQDDNGPKFMVTMESFKELWPYGNFGPRLRAGFTPINAGFFAQRPGADISEEMYEAYEWWNAFTKDNQVKYHDEQGALAWVLQDPIDTGRVALLDPLRYRVVCPLNDPPVTSLAGIVGLHATYPEHPAFHQFIREISKYSGVPVP